MILTPYQIVVPLVSALLVFYAWSLWMRQKKTMWETMLWTVFWGLIAVISLYPSLLSYIALVTGIKSEVNAIAVISIGILFFAVFYLIIRIEEMEQRITRVVRKVALKEAGLDREERDK
ncbi:DUF2304 domain-containing protein [Candidatus Peregrinibacteria bacterium]|nr:DUF2304 domain-containing protein [Candidatus Peregrinibacteria bacterium]